MLELQRGKLLRGSLVVVHGSWLIQSGPEWKNPIRPGRASPRQLVAEP
jgi:hypothetical protein